MKALVTGAGGFGGSHLCEALIEKGHKVKAFVRYNSRNTWGWLEGSLYKGEMEIIRGDIRDYDSVKDAAAKNADVIFHLAALPGIPYSYISPLANIKTNIEGTYNVLQAGRELGVQKIVLASTGEVYGTAQFVPITEEHPVNPRSPYGATKAGADFLALSFYRSFDLPVAVIRVFNTYGPRESARAIIPTVITQILAGIRKIKLGSLFPTRDFTYVKDVVEGYVKMAECDRCIGDVVNIGSNSETSMGNLVKLIAKLMTTKVHIEVENERKRPPKSEVDRIWADNRKAKELLGWSPKYTLEQGLKETIGWFKENLHWYKPEIYNV